MTPADKVISIARRMCATHREADTIAVRNELRLALEELDRTLAPPPPASPPSQRPDGLLNEEQAAAYLHKSVQTIRVWAWRRKGPPRVKIGRTVYYKQSSLDEWIESRETAPENRPPDPRP